MNIVWNLGKTILGTVSSNNNQFDIIEIPPNSISSGQYIHVRNIDSTFLFKDGKSAENYHVCVQWPPASGKIYSVFRGNQNLADKTFQSFSDEYCRFFFSKIDSYELFKTVVAQMHSHPDWHVIHHVSMLGFEPYFIYKSGDPLIYTQINTPAMPDGLFPLHIAVQNGHVHVISRLLGLGADVATVDPNGMTSLHFAAQKDEKTIKALANAPKCKDCVNNENGRGFTPLYLSMESGKPECFKALLSIGASATVPCAGATLLFHLVTSSQANLKRQECLKILLEACPQAVNETDMTTGNTVFHIVSDAQIMNILLRAHAPNVNLNARNGAGDTPLLTQMNRGSLDCFIKLLSYGAHTEERCAQGSTALHRSVEKNFINFVKALLIFGADTSVVDRNGDTALHLAAKGGSVAKKEILRCLQIAESPRCPPGKSGCTSECVHHEMDVQVVKPVEFNLHDYSQTVAISCALDKKRRGKKLENLLTLDGGGIRGLILIQILLYIEKRLNTNILSKFQWVAGTSTGAIVAAALCSGKTLRECQKLYFRFKDDVFGSGSRPYDTATLENFLKCEIGVHKTMASVQNHHKLVLTAVDGNVLPLKLHLIRSYQLPINISEQRRLGYEEPAAWPLWKAARCSSAAPTYFTAVDDKYIDGGLIANNPTLDLLTEVHNYNTALKMQNKFDSVIEIGCVLSVGTGRMPDSTMSPLKLAAPSGLFEAIAAAFAVKDLGKLLIEQVTESEERPVDRSRAVFHLMDIPYFRFSTRLHREVALDETKNDVLIEALWLTMEYMHSLKVSVDDLAGLLL